MATVHYLSLNSSVGTITVGGSKRKMNADEYNNLRPRLRNRVTSKREDLVLFDPQSEANEYLLASDFNIELKTDLTRALSSFSPIQQRTIIRVLLQGQSVREATKKMRQSTRTWARWLHAEALPRLRSFLDNYKEELTCKGNYNPKYIDAVGSMCAEKHTVKCKFCPHFVTTRDPEQSFNTLKKHIKKEHPAEFKPVAQYVHEKDYEIHMLESRIVEVPVAEEEEL